MQNKAQLVALYQPEMEKYELTIESIMCFINAIVAGNFNSIEKQFEKLEIEQRLGLANLQIQYDLLPDKLFVEFSLADHFSDSLKDCAFEFAKKLKHHSIAEFIEAQNKVLKNGFHRTYIIFNFLLSPGSEKNGETSSSPSSPNFFEKSNKKNIALRLSVRVVKDFLKAIESNDLSLLKKHSKHLSSSQKCALVNFYVSFDATNKDHGSTQVLSDNKFKDFFTKQEVVEEKPGSISSFHLKENQEAFARRHNLSVELVNGFAQAVRSHDLTLVKKWCSKLTKEQKFALLNFYRESTLADYTANATAKGIEINFLKKDDEDMTGIYEKAKDSLILEYLLIKDIFPDIANEILGFLEESSFEVDQYLQENSSFLQ